MKKTYTFLIVGFVACYSLFVFYFDTTSEYSSDIVVASVFFFALFSGFFIAKQSERYSKISEVIAGRDGHFSFLYRVSGLIPRIQENVRDIVREHYTKILKSGNLAYHEFNPSDTLTRLTAAFEELKDEEGSRPRISTTYEVIWDSLRQLQQARKQIIFLFKQRLLFFQWVLLYVLGFILIFSFDLIGSDSLIIDVLKIIFGTSVFLVIILLKQINDLSLFGKEFSERLANDVLRILNESDEREISEKGDQ